LRVRFISVTVTLIAGAALFAQTAGPTPGTTKLNLKDGLDYAWIPPGKFRMGCLGAVVERRQGPGIEECLNNELPRRSVTLSRGFWIGRTLVTQAAYRRVMGVNPSRFPGDQSPVEAVSWVDANAFCEKAGMRLPTEAEWEYSSRGGVDAERYDLLDRIAWYRGNSVGKTHPVAQKQPNAYGLYDMLGNVWEWVSDWYAAYPRPRDRSCCEDPGGPAVNPAGPKTGQDHVVRGGSWNDFSADVRMSLRDHPMSSPGEDLLRDYDVYSVGFRCAGD
jgi:formylglycine-generating enzyme required for sulfatase activity